jgi:hypothetical protein
MCRGQARRGGREQKEFFERDIYTKYIAPHLELAAWDGLFRVRELI